MLPFLIAVLVLIAPSASSALTLAQCERTTHPSHGGEAGHTDFGSGRVGYAEWWSQEGVFLDIVISDCQTGRFLKTRTREERITARPPFDRTDAAMRLIEVEMKAAPALFSFDRLASVLSGTGRDISVAVQSDENCACAAIYPEMRGNKAPFRVEP